MSRLRPAFILVCLFAHIASARPAADLTLRSERTDWRETSTNADVMAHLAATAALHPRMHLTTFGTSGEGRPLPLLVVGPETAEQATAAAVRASGRLRIYLQGNIHAGEVAGKEALLRLVRGLAEGTHPEWTRDWVLLIGPNYNPDGNDNLDLRHRLLQHGPVAGMGTRENAQGLDLNRDLMKLDAPESRALVHLLNTWDPHVVIDLHTTNGTHHAYHLTYAPGLHPATPPALDRFLRDELLPAVTEDFVRRWGWHLEHYGNVAERDGRRGWRTFDARPRYLTNYVGMRSRLAILSEVYSYLTFEDRVIATERFVGALLVHLQARRDQVQALVGSAATALPGTTLPLRGELPADPPAREILLGAVAEETHPLTGETILRRLEVVTPERMPVADAFAASDVVEVPEAYLLSAEATDIVAHLRLHGIIVDPLPPDWRGEAQEFSVASVQTAARPFQGRHEQKVTGRWSESRATTDLTGGYRVPLQQPLARLAVLLLEPTADDGLVNWGFLAPWLETNRPLPVWREPAQKGTTGRTGPDQAPRAAAPAS